MSHPAANYGAAAAANAPGMCRRWWGGEGGINGCSTGAEILYLEILTIEINQNTLWTKKTRYKKHIQKSNNLSSLSIDYKIHHGILASVEDVAEAVNC